MTLPTKLKLAAYGLLLLTLFLPFSRCSHGTPAPVTPPGATAASTTQESPPSSPTEQPAPGPATLPAPSPPSQSPWYHLFERNSPEAEYKYGMDLLIESWEVPTTLPTEFSPMMLVPGRMFYVWPLAALALAWWWPPVRWKRSFHFLEFVLGLGGMWWVMMVVFLDQAMRGFYLAEAALAVYTLIALWELIAEWRRLRRARRSALGAAE